MCPSSLFRYDFVPPVKYDYLNADEAEKRFEQRHKTLNYFSVMLSRKLREEEGGEKGEGGEGAGVEKGGKKKSAKRKSTSELVRCLGRQKGKERRREEEKKEGREGREDGREEIVL